MRGWMSEGRSYVAPVGLGEVMRGFSVGHIEASRHQGFKEGDAVPTGRCPIHQGSLTERAQQAVGGFLKSLGGKIAGIFRKK